MSAADAASGLPTDREHVDAVVLGAMDEEVAVLLRLARSERPLPEPEDVGRARSWRLTLRGRRVLLVRSGIGMVNAAAATVTALHRVAPDAILSTGSAGGIAGRVHVGDVAVGTTVTHAQADARAFGYVLGQVPGMPVDYPGDPDLLAAARTDVGVTVVPGLVVSADVFVDAERLPALEENFPRATATDMESAAIAQVAATFGVPFLTARGISDLCGPAAGSEHPRTVEPVSAASARVVLAALGIATTAEEFSAPIA